MAKFRPGDRVDRIDSLAPNYMQSGCIVAVIRDADWMTEYVVDFGDVRANLYEMQIRLHDPETSPSLNPAA
jgi:hypothetical protein